MFNRCDLKLPIIVISTVCNYFFPQRWKDVWWWRWESILVYYEMAVRSNQIIWIQLTAIHKGVIDAVMCAVMCVSVLIISLSPRVNIPDPQSAGRRTRKDEASEFLATCRNTNVKGHNNKIHSVYQILLQICKELNKNAFKFWIWIYGAIIMYLLQAVTKWDGNYLKYF